MSGVLEGIIARAWAALGVDPKEAADDPDTADLADSIRVSLQYERDGREQLRELADDLEERVDELAGKAKRSTSEYTRGLRDGMRVGLRTAARLARREATRLLRAQRRGNAQQMDDSTEDD